VEKKENVALPIALYDSKNSHASHKEEINIAGWTRTFMS
jgi:hypothetical protein